jgi:hypothetical protein
MTTEEAMRKVTGALSHPSLSRLRPDVVIRPGTDRTIRVDGPQAALDGFTRVLRKCGLETVRSAPVLLLVVIP